MAYRLILLLICMDVHPHPGPTITDIHSLDIFTLILEVLDTNLTISTTLMMIFMFFAFLKLTLTPVLVRTL